MKRAGSVLSSLLALLGLAGCGASPSGSVVSAPHIAAARQFTLGDFQPGGSVSAGRPTAVSFTVRLPSGAPLTQYRTGSGPHTGVHLILVRRDLAYIIHEHPPIGRDGRLTQTVTLPAPGPYRVLVDVYPSLPDGQPNFQLFHTLVVRGAYHPRPLPTFEPTQTVDGYRFAVLGRPRLRALQAQFLHVEVTDPQGRGVHLVPWFGALAHAIFFQQGSLDYFHSHICAPNAPNCGTLPGLTASRVTGSSVAPGKLTVGVLLPVPGTWRLFLQAKLNGRVITAPFTLAIGS